MYLLKIAFPYWSNVCFGCDWHILTSELALLSVSQKDENPALFPVISIRCRLAPYSLSSFGGSLGIGKRCFESRNNNTCSNPFIDGFLVLSKAQQQGVLRVTRRLFGYCRKWQLQGMFRVTPENFAAGLPLRSRATCLNLRYFYSVPCCLCQTISFCCTE